MPSVSGLIESALYVTDVRIAAAFYARVFAFGTLLESDRLIALDVAGKSVLLLFKRGATGEPFKTAGGVIPGNGGEGRSHFAFSIAAGEVDAWQTHLAKLGVKVESVVTWPTGAVSIYFRDPDDHLIELLTPGFWKTY